MTRRKREVKQRVAVHLVPQHHKLMDHLEGRQERRSKSSTRLVSATGTQREQDEERGQAEGDSTSEREGVKEGLLVESSSDRIDTGRT